jgi:ABC-type transporter Mla subunit MlaD
MTDTSQPGTMRPSGTTSPVGQAADAVPQQGAALDQIRGQAVDVASEVKKQAGDLTGQISSAADKVKSQAQEAVGLLRDSTEKLADRQKAAGAEQIVGIAHAIHSAADELDSVLPQAASYVRETADRVEQAAMALRERSIEDLLRTANDFARQQPAMFFGGTVLAGFLLSRFMKSSVSATDQASSHHYDYRGA